MFQAACVVIKHRYLTFPQSPENAVALLRDSFPFVLDSGSLSQRMFFEFLANFIEGLVALRARGYTCFLPPWLMFLVSYHIISSESNVDLYLLCSSLMTVLRVVSLFQAFG